MLETLRRSKKLQAYCQAVEKNQDLVLEELWDAPKSILTALAAKSSQKNILIITGRAKEENRLLEDLAFFYKGKIEDFPAWETLPTEKVSPSPDIVGVRSQVLYSLLQDPSPQVIVSSLQSCLQKLIPPQKLQNMCFEIKVGQEHAFSELIEKLSRIGYERKAVTADKGEFSVRGGIIDIFPVASADPVRMEFWGDEIDSLRFFDPVGQKSVRQIDKIFISPALEMEFVFDEPHLCSIFDYLGPNTLVIFDDIADIEDRYVTLEGITGGATATFYSFEQFYTCCSTLQKIFWSQTELESLSEVTALGDKDPLPTSIRPAFQSITFEIFMQTISAWRWTPPFRNIQEFLCPSDFLTDSISPEDLYQGIHDLQNSDYHLILLCPSQTDKEYLQSQLRTYEVSLPKRSHFEEGYLSSGFAIDDASLAVLPTTEFTKRYKIRRQKQRSTYHTTPSEMHEIAPGDHVVHLHSGVGKFLGIEKQRSGEDIYTEFFVIEYADNAKLFLPLSQAHLITKYIGSKEDETPQIHRLGSNRWKKSKIQAERSIMGYASDLLKLYAERSLKVGFRCPPHGPDMNHFEQDFPFIETEDQLQAIASVFSDMQSKQPMDRLICGDVGYGKTEVAMRAAFKACVDGGKQVAVLVPTTVLALQHYETFLERMWNYPVRIAVLSRFGSSKETKKTLEAVKNGAVDILIGTHRIIGKDVVYKDLGLLIIDEEQRFGVRAKEYLKSAKKGIDCLSLSATPIPRTLYLSLLGAREMSTINTPPQDRLPIKTIVCNSDDEVIKNALLRELTRDGQAYFIHNRIASLFKFLEKIQLLVPQAEVAVAHGRMSSEEIDRAFHDFKSGQADILLATTIVENGIDIPNANTILIDRADTYGLADLYQLRGRVGRWNRRAYAYFLTPKKQSLPAITRKRLEALVESGGIYGGGMKVAMRDLEIRGAGNILGVEQSGHVSSIGFHFYCKLLKRTIETLKGNLPSTICDTKVEFSIDAQLPEDYINATSLRLEIYQRLGEAVSCEEVDQIMEEVQDRFGPPPEPVLWLHHLYRIKVFASLHHITQIKVNQLSILVEGREKGELTKKTLPIKKTKSPQDFEKKVLQSLKKAFSLRSIYTEET